MRDYIKTVAKNPLISGSFIIFAGGILGNLFNFLFNVLMSRNLPVSEYGTLISLISLITLLSIPAGSVIPTVVSVAGSFFAKSENDSVNSLYFKLLRPILTIGVLFVAAFTVFGNPIGKFLNIHESYFLVISSLIVAISYIGTLNTAFMQAKLSFTAISISSVVSAALKFSLGFALVIFGYGLNGALLAYLISFLTPIFVGVFILRKILFVRALKKVAIPTKSLVSFGIPSAIIILCLNSYISTDIILVKHLFTAENAGLYAGISLIGRVIYFLTAPIVTVMFPVITNRFSKNEDHKNILFTAISLVGLGSLLITLFYFLFPDFTILLFLKKSEYLTGDTYLGLFGIFIALYTMVSLMSYYFVSIKQTKIVKFLIFGALLQAFGIYIFHAGFLQVIYVSIITMGILLSGLLYFYKFGKINLTADKIEKVRLMR